MQLSPPKKVIFEKVQFDSDPEWVIIEEAITMVGTETAVNIQSNVKKSIPDNSLINIELSKEKMMGEYNAVVKSGDVAVCGLLKNATGQPFFKPIITKLLEFTNLPHQCPFPVVSRTLMTNLWVIVGHLMSHDCPPPQGEYWIKDFMIDSSMIPDIIPEGRYKVVAGIFQPLPSHKLIYESEWIFSIAKTAI